ncbi:unnamed protein product [Enterobius vermicularis]|uniref:Ubiquitin carboxyl-terminal hydrolase n=1 Tax=Enterobius vermicularis TaxID=51028 RepID=A0A0N4VEE7_ENTVE|nr:unnamed protein product [Enterobius vermicularis]
MIKAFIFRAFGHAEKLHSEAEDKRKHGDEEQAYILYYRMCEIASMIKDKNDFGHFKMTPDGRLLRHIFEEALSKLDELEKSLTEQYEKKRIEKPDVVQRETISSSKSPAEVDDSKDVTYTILPRDLMTFVKNQKKVLFIDYREDSSSFIKYDRPEGVFVARVPPNAIVPGYIGQTLIRSAPVSERVNLQRMGEVDLVVLVGTETPVIKEGGLQKGSREQILFDALYMYNNNFRLQRPPVFLDGGFSNWKQHYPMYVTSEAERSNKLEGLEPSTKLSLAVSRYTEDLRDIERVTYPDLRDGSNRHVTTSSYDMTKKRVTASPKETVLPRQEYASWGSPLVAGPSDAWHFSDLGGEIHSDPESNSGFKSLSAPQEKNVDFIQQKDYLLVYRSDKSEQLLLIFNGALQQIDKEAIKERVRRGFTGLKNLGNTCYMNATLQALFNTLPLRRIFLSQSYLNDINRTNRKGTRGICSVAFSALMEAAWSGKYSVINPSFFRSIFVSHVNHDFGDFKQHDAQEFQIFLLAALHEDMDKVQEPKIFEQNYTGKNLQKEALEFEENWRLYTNSLINDVFRCITLSVKKCGTCNYKSVSFEEITQLSIAISETSLSECIASHFKEISLKGESRWKCPDCNHYRDSSLKTGIWRTPQILVIHLKRSFDGVNKNDTLVAFGTDTLDLKSCLHSSATSSGSRYKLYAVTNHIGSLNSGHYVAYIRNVQDDGTTQWLVVDDDVVRPISENVLCTKHAVVLYYIRTD